MKSPSYLKKPAYLIFLFLLAASCLGCNSGSSDIPDLGSVSGLVTLNGEPLPFATVTFWPISGGRTSFGVSNEAGHYELTYQGDLQGAKIGPCRVFVTTQSEDIYDDETGETLIRASQKELVPQKYNDNSELKFVVEAGPNIANFELEGSR